MKTHITVNIPTIPFIAIVVVACFIFFVFTVEKHKSEKKAHAETQCSRFCNMAGERTDSYYEDGICQCG